MPKKKDPNIIRVGDTVKIMQPDFFVRVGYPMTVDMARKEVIEKFDKDIKDLLKKTKLPDTERGESGFATHGVSLYDLMNPGQVYDRIVSALAYGWVRINRFGGNERKIYTMNLDRYKGEEATVDSIRYVKTGTYVRGAGSTYDEWSGEYDYDPSYLDDQKTHKILKLRYKGFIGCVKEITEIEDIHVEKVHEECLNHISN